MSEGDASSFTLDPLDGGDAVAAAFDRMGRRVAGLAAAVEGFAARQQEIHGRDYGPDLEKIHAVQAQFRDAIKILDKRPAMQLTVEGIAADIANAGLTARAGDHLAFERAQQQLAASTQKLEGIVAGSIDLRKQCTWLAAAAGAILVIGVIMGDLFPPMLDRTVPESWHWPESRAAGDLDMSGTDAGQRLLQISDPAGWHQLVDADRLVQANAATIAECRARATSRKEPVDCSIVVNAPAA